MWIINEIRRQRRENMLKEERMRLIVEDEREERELKNYVVQALAASIGTMLPTSPTNSPVSVRGDEAKVPSRRNGAEQWMQAGAEDGSAPPPEQPPREGH